MSALNSGFVEWARRQDWLSLISNLIAVGSAAWFTFARFAWRWPSVKQLVGRPDLNGSWFGVLQSQWIDPATGVQVPPIRIGFVVKQRFDAITLTMISPESRSVTVTASLTQDEAGEWTVTAVYRNEPGLAVRHRSAIHHGSFRLRVIDASERRLDGDYWTERSTRGSITVEHVTKRRVFDHAALGQLADNGHRVQP